MTAKQAKFTNATEENSEIHGGSWHTSRQAYGGSEHDAEISILSDDGIVATAATIHCGRIRAEEVAKLIAAAPDMLAALELFDRSEHIGEYADRSGSKSHLHDSCAMKRQAIKAVRAAIAKAKGA